jgi:hypothetical protein
MRIILSEICGECASSAPARSDGYFDQTPAERSENAFFFIA